MDWNLNSSISSVLEPMVHKHSGRRCILVVKFLYCNLLRLRSTLSLLLCSLEEERNVWTSPAIPLNSKTNEAVKFKITAMARGYKLTLPDLEVSNETIDCGKDPEQCGSK